MSFGPYTTFFTIHLKRLGLSSTFAGTAWAGVFYLAAMQSMDMLVPEGLRATAQGVFASVVFGLSALVGSAVSGFLYEPLGMAWLYAAAAVLASAATVLYWVGTRQTVAAARVAAGRVSEGSSR